MESPNTSDDVVSPASTADSFATLLSNPWRRAQFRGFLEHGGDKRGVGNLLFWEDSQAFRQGYTAQGEAMSIPAALQRAVYIADTYISMDKAQHGTSIPKPLRMATEHAVHTYDRCGGLNTLFDACEVSVVAGLEALYPAFVAYCEEEIRAKVSVDGDDELSSPSSSSRFRGFLGSGMDEASFMTASVIMADGGTRV